MGEAIFSLFRNVCPFCLKISWSCLPCVHACVCVQWWHLKSGPCPKSACLPSRGWPHASILCPGRIPSPLMSLLTLELPLEALVQWPLILNRQAYHLSFVAGGKSVRCLLLGI